MHELADGALDHLRLVGDLLDLDALRHGLHEIIGRLLDILAEFENVGALGGDHADANRRLAFLAGDEGRRIDETMRDGRDIAEPEHAAVAFDRALRKRLCALARARAAPATARCAPRSGPVPRRGTAFDEGSTVPAGVTLFCLASESNSACGVIPSVASLACEHSTKRRSSWEP